MISYMIYHINTGDIVGSGHVEKPDELRQNLELNPNTDFILGTIHDPENYFIHNGELIQRDKPLTFNLGEYRRKHEQRKAELIHNDRGTASENSSSGESDKES